MLQLLYKYFILTGKVCFPGIGVFKMHYQPASFLPTGNVITPPSATLIFKAGEEKSLHSFFSFASRELDVEISEAAGDFNEYIYQLREKLLRNGSLELPGFGKLLKDENGQVHFTGNTVPTFLTGAEVKEIINTVPGNVVHTHEMPVQDKQATDETIEETVAEKDYWWLYALIIAAIAIAAIIVYYRENGSLS